MIESRLALGLSWLIVLAAGCGTGTAGAQADARPKLGDGGPPCAPLDDAGTAPQSVSFRRDVLPIFASNCTESGCHGDRTGAQAGLYLGPNAPDGGVSFDDATVLEVWQQIANKPSSESTLLRIAPGDPSLSFLYRKVTRQQNCGGVICDPPVTPPFFNCGDNMPSGDYSPLTADEVATLRAWIEAGAGND